MNNNTTNTDNTNHRVGDVVVFADAHDEDRGHCGTVTRVLGQTHLATRVRTVSVWVETADGETFVGDSRNFFKVS